MIKKLRNKEVAGYLQSFKSDADKFELNFEIFCLRVARQYEIKSAMSNLNSAGQEKIKETLAKNKKEYYNLKQKRRQIFVNKKSS